MTNYEEKVTEGRQLAKRSEDDQWRLAELTWQVKHEDDRTLTEWAKDVGVGGAYVGRLHLVWDRWSLHARADRPSFADAYNMANEGGDTPEEARERRSARETSSKIRNSTPERKAEIARELLSDPEVAEKISEEITDHVAADSKRTAAVVSKRQAAMPKPEVDEDEPRPKRDYDELAERYVNGLSVVLAAESSGKWKPSERSEALLYFLTQILGNRREPSGEQATFVNEKLESLFDEVEAYANSEVA